RTPSLRRAIPAEALQRADALGHDQIPRNRFTSGKRPEKSSYVPRPPPPGAEACEGGAFAGIGCGRPCNVRIKPDAVVFDLDSQLPVVAPVAVSHDRARLVDEGVSFLQNAKEHFQIAAAVGWCSNVQRRV